MLPTTDDFAQSESTPDSGGEAPHAAPPTSPGLISRAHLEPSWPGVLGIMCLVYGILITIVAMFSLAAPFLMIAIARLLPPDASATMGLMQPPRIIVLNSIYYLPALFLNAWLAALGLRLYQKSPVAPPRMRLWSFIKIGLEIMCAVITFVVTLESMNLQQELFAKQVSTSPGAPPPPNFLASNWWVYGSASMATLWSLVLGLAMPLFLLIWFRRQSVRAYVATWGGGTLAAPQQ